jgi:hemoglobin
MKRWIRRAAPIAGALLLVATGCGSQEKKDRGFFTSGSHEADQRAEQRMAKADQLAGKSEKDGAKQANEKKSLYDRLGAEQGIDSIVDDFVSRAVADPRINWERKGVTHGGFLGIGSKSSEWSPTVENLEGLKQHLAQFLALATGGPVKYEGREIGEVHRGMHVTNAEFDAAIGDLKATLDKVQLPNPEQKELIAIVESTRPQIVEDR